MMAVPHEAYCGKYKLHFRPSYGMIKERKSDNREGTRFAKGGML